ncbi:MAG: ankyrin repeat protein [Halieaceae bacterium]|jgi:ankyrin repeat protein
MKILLFSAIAAVAFINANANAINGEKIAQRVAYVEVAQTIERDGNNNTALMSAAAYGETEIARNLIARGTDVNARGYIGNTALIFAVEEGHTAIARMLIEAGANPDANNDYGNTARTLAKGYGQREIVELFETTPLQTRPALLATAL